MNGATMKMDRQFCIAFEPANAAVLRGPEQETAMTDIMIDVDEARRDLAAIFAGQRAKACMRVLPIIFHVPYRMTASNS